MSIDAFRGHVFDFDPDGLKVLEDQVLVVDAAGKIAFMREASRISEDMLTGFKSLGLSVSAGGEIRHQGRRLEVSQTGLMTPTVNSHDHAFQPPGIGGPLLRPDGTGWLPTTLAIGEAVAKKDPEKARLMARQRLQEFAENGIGRLLEYTTSCENSARIFLEEAQNIGVKAMVGYVAMDQEVDSFGDNLGLEESTAEIIRATKALIDDYPGQIVVIDRFPIAVSSPTRRELAQLALDKRVLYETHMDETKDEQALTGKLYSGKTIAQVLDEDGVFKPGMQVGLAHAIHTSEEDFAMIADRIEAGCKVSIRACPNSNNQLGSHNYREDEEGPWSYAYFPVERWREIGALVTLGTDQGAGHNNNLFKEMEDGRGRHPSGALSYVGLLRMGTVNGLESLGVDLSRVAIEEGNFANLLEVELAGAGVFYDDANQPLEDLAARLVQGGANPKNIGRMFVDGRKVKCLTNRTFHL